MDVEGVVVLAWSAAAGDPVLEGHGVGCWYTVGGAVGVGTVIEVGSKGTRTGVCPAVTDDVDEDEEVGEEAAIIGAKGSFASWWWCSAWIHSCAGLPDSGPCWIWTLFNATFSFSRRQMIDRRWWFSWYSWTVVMECVSWACLSFDSSSLTYRSFRSLKFRWATRFCALRFTFGSSSSYRKHSKYGMRKEVSLNLHQRLRHRPSVYVQVSCARKKR